MSGKPWPEFFVLGDTSKLTTTSAGTEILGAMHRATDWGAESLVIFSVVALFISCEWCGAAVAQAAGSVAGRAAAAMVVSDLPQRFLLGRPFILTITVLMTILFVAARSAAAKMAEFFAGSPALIAASAFRPRRLVFCGCCRSAAFFFAGQFRWALLLAGAWAGGTFWAPRCSPGIRRIIFRRR